MNKRTALLGLLSGAVSARATTTSPGAVESGILVGAWEVDLRSRPDAPAYLKRLVVTELSGSAFTGSFYDSTITEGRINTAWGAVRVALITSDGIGAYYHSAVLTAGHLEGLSHAPHRNLLAYWTATKK